MDSSGFEEVRRVYFVRAWKLLHTTPIRFDHERNAVVAAGVAVQRQQDAPRGTLQEAHS